MKPDSPAAIGFLKSVYPEGAWAVSAIDPKTGKIETRTFSPKTEHELGSWLAPRNGHVNLYWHVNEPTRPLTKKGEKADIKAVHFLHVDIDPRTGEDFDAERKRILSLLTDKLPDGVPSPSFIIDSGGGFQAFWRLQEPIVIDGDLGKAAEAERYNRWLEMVFGADACHDVSRIMRLPGTINIPNVKKAKAGRRPALARVVEKLS